MIRYSMTFIVSLQLVGIAKMSLDEWGGWILILNYGLFIIKSYTWIDVRRIIWRKAFSICLKRKKKSPKKEILREFEKIFSGVFIDIQLISCCRFLMLCFFKRWSFETYYFYFYQDCEFRISEDFPVEFGSVLVMVSMNVIAVVSIIIYIKRKKDLIMVYTVVNNGILNLYILFTLHFYMEGALQLFAANLFFNK